MIPGAFDYHRPHSIGDALALLARLGAEARPLAGGHSLIPLMKTRLAAPNHLVDLAAIADLKGIREAGKEIVIGAMTQAAEIWLAERGIVKAQLMVRPNNDRVRAFYEALGYGEQQRIIFAKWLDGRDPTP